MNRLFACIFAFISFKTGISQSNANVSKTELAKIYCQAIGDFIKEANKNNKTNFKILYFGKRKNGLADDFPDVELPELIENTYIKLISPEQGAIKQKEDSSCIYINLFGWVTKKDAEFIFVVFSNGFAHQYDYTIKYTYNTIHKAFELASIERQKPDLKK